MRSTATSDGTYWKFQSMPNGTFKIISKCGEANDYALAINTSNSTAGIKLIQGEYDDDNSSIYEWYIHMQKDYTLMYIGYEDGDPLMPPILASVSSELKENAHMDGYGYTALSKQALLEHLSSSSIFSCITHGLSNAIAVTGEESLCINDINSLHSTAFDNLDFVYLGACFTGAGKNDSNNLVNAFYNKGATAVLGFSVKTIVAQTNLWTSYFMEELSKGKTVTEAAVVADARISVNPKFADVVSFSTQPDNRYYVGPESYAPCLPF